MFLWSRPGQGLRTQHRTGAHVRLFTLRRTAVTTVPPVDPDTNVRVLRAGPSRADAPVLEPYAVLDGTGVRHELDVITRRDALRAMSNLCLRGVPLPLVLVQADGTPTGDRIG
jgi:hypothetical protein